MKVCLLSVCVLFCSACVCLADDAQAALALAEASAKSCPCPAGPCVCEENCPCQNIAITCSPPEKVRRSFHAVYTEAVASGQPLLLGVGVAPPEGKWDAHEVARDELPTFSGLVACKSRDGSLYGVRVRGTSAAAIQEAFKALDPAPVQYYSFGASTIFGGCAGGQCGSPGLTGSRFGGSCAGGVCR